mgnify:CR=1 FL=1
MNELQRQFGAPVHHQLYALLRSDIVSNRYGYGDMLPGEEALRETFDVSRTTVRRALLTLEQEGLIERRQGRGTRVIWRGETGAAVSTISDVLTGISRLDETSSLGLLTYEFVQPPGPIRSQLGMQDGELALHIVRVRTQGDQPLWHLTNYIPEALGRRLDRSLVETATLYEALKQAGSPCVSAEELLGATLADPVIALRLAVNVGAPLLESHRVMLGADETPICVQVTLIPPERRRVRIRVFADESAALPAAGAPGLLTPDMKAND